MQIKQFITIITIATTPTTPTTATTATTCVTTENGHCFLRCEKFSRLHGRNELYW